MQPTRVILQEAQAWLVLMTICKLKLCTIHAVLNVTNICIYIGCYYFTLGNIHPIYRSSLNSIQLLCLVEAPVLDQYGHDKVLELAIKDIRKLEQVHMYM